MFEELLSAIRENPGLSAGWAIVGGFVLQSTFHLGGAVRRYLFDKRRIRLEQHRLNLEIHAARVRIETAQQAKVAWNGTRKFTVTQKVLEAADAFSFYLKPHDGKSLPAFHPGQYLTFQLSVPGESKPVVRCYSLSDSSKPNQYRVTIKRCPPPSGSAHPPGKGSSFFHDVVEVGDILDVKAPAGHFYLDLEKPRPVVLISGGIGVTPMVTMANALIEAGDTREIWFFFGTRNSSDHMFKAYMAELEARHPRIRVHVCYSQPLTQDIKGRDYHHQGRVTVALFKQLLPSTNYDYFLCGPGAFMESITADLRHWGVPDSWVHYEAFGPASVKKTTRPPLSSAPSPSARPITVTFAKSGKTAPWDPACTSLLELADANGIRMDAGCRAGNCGSCLVAIKSGSVEYLTGTGADVEKGSCLACVCKPSGPIEIDA